MLPALVSVFDSEVTSLGRFIARSAWVCAAFRQAILSRRKRCAGFPNTKPEAQGTAPYGCSQFGTVSSESYWQALCYVSNCAFHG